MRAFTDETTLVLIGPMGVGKTTVGKKLARALKREFIDTDSLVVSKHGEISKIFETSGEAVFRGYEEDAVAEAISRPAVVATGGGAVLSKLTRERLAEKSIVIYLSTDGRHIRARLVGGKRPLVKNGFDDWIRIYEERKPVYEEASDLTIDTSGKSLAATVTEIKERLGIQ
ncbi:MAG: shikimate kinase [Micrococcales bacterium]